MGFKVKRRKKSHRARGNTTYGHGSRKKWKKSGHRGGVGMAGTGKRADHRKSYVIRLYGNNYFGKQGITSRSTEKKKDRVINVGEIEQNFDSIMKKFGKGNELVLKEYKVLGEGEFNRKIVIKAKSFSEGAIEKIEKAGGSALKLNNQEKTNDNATNTKKILTKENKTTIKKEK